MMELQELRALGLAGAAVDDRDLSSNWFSLQVCGGGAVPAQRCAAVHCVF